MAEPWDVPAFPTHGDFDIDTIYRAKGHAVSEWERVEVALSAAYAVFSGHHWDRKEAYRKYGTPLNFKDRAATLHSLACTYFLQAPDQDLEGEFDQLMVHAKNFAVRRNEITHSLISYRIVGTRGILENAYYLVPPHYTDRKFDENDRPTFVYTTSSIEEFALKFRDLSLRVDLFVGKMTANHQPQA